MSGYRSIHREQVLETAIWSVQTSPLLVSSSSQQEASAYSWRVGTASASGVIHVYRAQETSIDAKKDALDASALKFVCTHTLVGQEQEQPGLGCTCLCLTRNYMGDDTTIMRI